MNVKKVMGWCLTILASYASYAQAESAQVQVNCRSTNVKYLENNVLLYSSKRNQQRLYLIHNTGKSTLWVDHPVDEPSASAGWATQIGHENWSAIALREDSFQLKCVEIRPGAEQFVPCSGTLEVCELTDARFHPKNVGTYWVAENKPLHEVINVIRSRGIDLP